jgi:hypothetical protein
VKFVIEHTYDRITPAEYEVLHFDETFSAALGEALGLGRTLVRLDRTPERIVRHIRCVPKRDPKDPAAQVLDDKASFVEELEYEVGRFRGQWRTIPSMMPDRVTTTGTIELEAVPGGTKRIVRGEVRVAIFAIGRIVERFIVAEIVKSYAGAARFTADWLVQSKST